MKYREFWFFLFIAGLFLFNWPFLEIFGLSLPYYLFGAWLIFICIVAVFVKRQAVQANKPHV